MLEGQLELPRGVRREARYLLRAIARRILRLAGEAPEVRPPWLTKEFASAVFSGPLETWDAQVTAALEGLPPTEGAGPAASTPPRAPTARLHRLRERAVEIYVTEEKEVLKEKVLSLPTSAGVSGRILYNKIRAEGKKKFAMLSADKQEHYQLLAQGCFDRQRGEDGQFKANGTRCVDEVKLIELATPPKELPPAARLGRRTLARFGAAFVQQVQRDIGFDRTRLVASVCKDVGLTRRRLKKFLPGFRTEGLYRRWKTKGDMPTRPSGVRKGRAFKSFKMNDGTLKDALQPFVSPSSRWSRRSGEVLQTLRGSLASVYSSCEELKGRYSYRQVARRLLVKQAARLGISAGKRRTDVCRTCVCWDKAVSPRVRAALVEVKETLAGQLEWYWHSWKKKCEENGWIEDESVLLNEQYFRALVDYIRVHPRSHRDQRRGIDEAAMQMIEGVTVDTLTGGDAIVQAVAEFALHFRLRDYLADKLREQCEEPAEGYLYCWSDFKELFYWGEHQNILNCPPRPPVVDHFCPPRRPVVPSTGKTWGGGNPNLGVWGR